MIFRRFATIFILLLSAGCSYPDRLHPGTYLPFAGLYGIEIIMPQSRIYESQGVRADLYLIFSSGEKMPCPADAVSWGSSDESVLTVDDRGGVRAVSFGRAAVLAHYSGYSAGADLDVWRAPDYSRIMITEVFYDPPGADDGREFIEISNRNDFSCDLSNHAIVDGANASEPFLFPDGFIIGQEQTVVIASSDSGFLEQFGFLPDLSGLKFMLNNNGEAVFLKKPDGSTIDRVYIKGGTADCPAPREWGSVSQPVSVQGNSVQRKREINNGTFEDWTAGPPSPGAF